MRIKVLVADDHPIVRDGLRRVLGDQGDMELVDETGDGLSVVPLVERLRPDVLVLDLKMPGMGGLEIARQVRARAPHTRVVILSMYNDEGYVAEALEAGAQAYVLKQAVIEDLVQAIRAVLAGERYLSQPLTEEKIESYQRLLHSGEGDLYNTLTPREREVLNLIAEGQSNKAMAQRMKISVRTVEMHRANLMKKLGANSTAQVVRFAMEREIDLGE